jgi:hypothetical protein
MRKAHHTLRGFDYFISAFFQGKATGAWQRLWCPLSAPAAPLIYPRPGPLTKLTEEAVRGARRQGGWEWGSACVEEHRDIAVMAHQPGGRGGGRFPVGSTPPPPPSASPQRRQAKH